MPSEELNCALAREVGELLRKEAIEVVPPQQVLEGHYSRYFLVHKKPEGFRPILDLRGLNPTVSKKQFRMLTNAVLLGSITHRLSLLFCCGLLASLMQPSSRFYAQGL